jgi:glycosyltransferase involved in cell wall biosynthesis
MPEKVKHIVCTVTNDLSYDQRMQRICSSLSNAGYRVTLVGRRLKNSKTLNEFNFKQKRLKCIFNKGKLFYLEYNIRLYLFFLFLRNYDAICSVDLDTLLAGTLAAKLRRKKLVYDAHEYFTEVPELVERPRVQKIWAKIGAFCIPKCDAAYTVCQSLASTFKSIYKKDFEVIRNLPLAQPLSDSISVKEKKLPYILLYQGMLNDGRGLEEMIEAMRQFDADKVQLWLAGEGDLSAYLRQKTTALNLDDRIKFWGFVEPKELKIMTKKADIGLNLLKNKGLNYYYSLANKFFDYVMAEKPSINMDFPEYSLHTAEFEVALLLPDLSADSIVKSINNLLNDCSLYSKLQENCLKAKMIWNWELEEQKLLAVYSQLFHKKR